MINEEMKQTGFYDGSKLLSMLDLDNKKPEIYLCTSNRSAGKTTYFSRYFVNRFIKYHEKFVLLYRFNYELDDISNKFFKDINRLFFPSYAMTDERRAAGIYHELFLHYPDETEETPHAKSCGYAISINSADQLKKYSHLLSDVSRILFDEFQSETGHYCNNEIKKFLSVHTTIARGAGQQSRYLPVIMLSNSVSILNPYYVNLGIAARLQKQTKFLRGNGWILEQNYNAAASAALVGSSFLSAFSQNDYAGYAANGQYLNDSNEFIAKMPESGSYLCTFAYDGCNYSIKEYAQLGCIYVSDSYDKTYPYRIAVDLPDHRINYVLLSKNDSLIRQFSDLFNRGSVRFKNQQCKNAFIALIAYKML